MSGKFALIIGNTEYTDPGLAQLTAPGKDAEDFARVLKDQDIGAFDEVNILLNEPEYVVREAIGDFFNLKTPDDLLVLYFSGHGVRDELGALYLAVKNTVRSKLRATGVKSDYIRDAMDQSRSKRQVLILDCCNSGAFEHGAKSATGVSIGTASAFEVGYGRIILTASDSTQFAWEGDKVIGETDNSLFTHFLVEGLEGAADLDSDGRITVDELYDYAYEKVRLATPKQTPSKFSSKQQGEIVLRESMPIEKIKPLSLPDDLIDEIEDLRPYVREVAVQKLEKLLKGKSIGLARSARESLEQIAAEDDSNRLRQLARQALESVKHVKIEQEAKIVVERLAHIRPEHKAAEKITPKTTEKAKYEPAKGHSAKFYSIWWSVLTDPTEANYQTIIEDPNVSQRKAYWWIFVAGVICSTILPSKIIELFGALLESEIIIATVSEQALLDKIKGIFELLSNILKIRGAISNTSSNILIISILWLLFILITGITVSLFFVVVMTIHAFIITRIAKAIGGQSDFTKLVYLFASFSAPAIIGSSLISGLLSIDSALFSFGLLCIVWVGFLYPLILGIIATKAVNKITWGSAIVSGLAFPIILLLPILITVLNNIQLFGQLTGNTRP